VIDVLTAYNEHLSRNKRRPTTAISVESGIWLQKKLDELKPKRIVDFGSGFSSLLFHAWAQENEARAVTVDLSPVWLEVVKIELAAAGLSVRDCYLIDELPGDMMFDFALVDLGATRDRLDRIESIFVWLAPGATLVLDDWHMDHYREPMKALLSDRGLKAWRLESTKDQYGRYMAKVVLP